MCTLTYCMYSMSYILTKKVAKVTNIHQFSQSTLAGLRPANYTFYLFSVLLINSKSNICLGDCCLPKIQTLYCSDCICHEDGTRHPESLCPVEFIGNKFCSDENNIVECDYDGGKYLSLSKMLKFKHFPTNL